MLRYAGVGSVITRKTSTHLYILKMARIFHEGLSIPPKR